LEKSLRSLNFPTLEGIVELNRRHIQETGGFYVEPENLRYSAGLEWVLDAIQHLLFTIDIYPSLAEKAAILGWVIINDHVFHDGSKRTGMSALEAMVRINDLHFEVTPNEIVETAIRIASHRDTRFTLQDLVNWVRNKLALEEKNKKGPAIL